MLSPIEELMNKKLGATFHRFVLAKNGNKILMRKLKEVLSIEIRTMLERSGMTTPPFDPFSIKMVGKAKIHVEFVSGKKIRGDGVMEICSDGFLIKIDDNLKRQLARHRLRSTMAHELMHTFFYDVKRLPPAKLGHISQSRKHFLMEEELCHFLAREFLVPTFPLLDLIAQKKSLKAPSIRNMEFLKRTFVVSSDIMAYRIISDLTIWNAMFIKFVKERNYFRAKTRLKNKINRSYKKVKLPTHVPLEFSTAWAILLSNHVQNAANLGRIEELFRLNGQMLALESLVETQNPVSIMTLIYEID